MRPKGKLFALLAVFMAIAVVAATGAFTTVSAERTATANVAGDGSALLQLQPYDGPNGNGTNGYASLNNNVLEITFGNGFNQNATTHVENVFNITNNGAQPVTVNITDAGENDNMVTFYNQSTGNSIEDTNSVTLGVGDKVTVSIKVDTTAQAGSLSKNEELITNFTVNADAN